MIAPTMGISPDVGVSKARSSAVLSGELWERKRSCVDGES